ncbi:hypothetical protein ACTQV0_03350 [Selenomonas montiformis]|nr:hypothetical protein [Selenomonas montiformis]
MKQKRPIQGYISEEGDFAINSPSDERCHAIMTALASVMFHELQK